MTAVVANTTAPSVADRLQGFLSSSRVLYLDGFRALAALIVMLSHFHVPSVSGTIGVAFAFFISGFLITHLLCQEAKKSKNQLINIKAFFVRRVFRLLPALFVFVLGVTGIYAALGLATPWHEIWPSLVFLQNYHMIAYPPEMALPFNMLWSLSIEEHYYLLAPFVFFLAMKFKKQEWLIGLGIAVILLGLVWRFFAVTQLNAGWRYLYLATECRIDSILYGVLLALIIHQAHHTPQKIYAKALSWVITTPWLSWVALALFYFIWQEDNRYVFFILQFPIFGVCFAIILTKLLFTPELPWLKTFLTAPIIRGISAISYSIFLWNIAVYRLTSQWYVKPLFMPPFGSALIAICLTIGVATISYWLIEKPAIAWRKQLFKPKHAAEQSTTYLGYHGQIQHFLMAIQTACIPFYSKSPHRLERSASPASASS